MSYFRNVQNSGTWRAGNIFTFELNNNEIFPAETTTIPHAEYEWEWTGYKNYWSSHGAWHSDPDAPYPGAGSYDPPVNWGWEIEEVPRCSWPLWTQAGGYWHHEWQNPELGFNSTRSGGGRYGIGSHWTSTRRIGTFVFIGQTCISVNLTRKFKLVGESDIISQACGLEYEPQSGETGIQRYAFTLQDDEDGNQVEAPIDGLTVLYKETLEDGWIRYYVEVNKNAPPGNHYLKGKTYHVTGGGLPG